MGYSIHTSTKKAIIQEGIVPYEKQTPEQRQQLIGRVASMILLEMIGEILRENFKYIAGSVPEKPVDKELKILRSKLNQMKKDIPDMISKFKGFSALYKSLCTANSQSYDQFEVAGFYAADIINNVHKISLDKFELLNNITDAVAKGEINSMSDEDHDSEMIQFAQYCMNLKNRKLVTKKDLEKFKNLRK